MTAAFLVAVTVAAGGGDGCASTPDRPPDGPPDAAQPLFDAGPDAPPDAPPVRPTQIVWEKVVGPNSDPGALSFAAIGDGVAIDTTPALAAYGPSGDLLGRDTSNPPSVGGLHPWGADGTAVLWEDHSGNTYLDFYDAAMNPAGSLDFGAQSASTTFAAATTGSTTYLLVNKAKAIAPQQWIWPLVLDTISNGAVTKTQQIATGRFQITGQGVLMSPDGHILACTPSTTTSPHATLEVLHIDPGTGQMSAFPLAPPGDHGYCHLVKMKDRLFALWADSALQPNQFMTAVLSASADTILAGPRPVALPGPSIQSPSQLAYDGTHIVGSWIDSDTSGLQRAHLFTIDPTTLTIGPVYEVSAPPDNDADRVAVAGYQGSLYLALNYGISLNAQTVVRKLVLLK